MASVEALCKTQCQCFFVCLYFIQVKTNCNVFSVLHHNVIMRELALIIFIQKKISYDDNKMLCINTIVHVHNRKLATVPKTIAEPRRVRED